MLVMIIVILVLLLILAHFKVRRDWEKRQDALNLLFASMVASYRLNFGAIESGQIFLRNVESNADVRNREINPAATTITRVASMAANTSATMGASVAAGVGYAAWEFLADFFSKVGANRDKSPEQVRAEEQIAEFCSDAAKEKYEADSFSQILVFAVIGLSVVVLFFSSADWRSWLR